jgi:paired amphipathic helix protein Sin3a
MPEKMQQLFDDREDGMSALEMRGRTNTPLSDPKNLRRKIETSMAPPLTRASPGAGSTLPQKRKRRTLEREKELEREKDVAANVRTGSSNKVGNLCPAVCEMTLTLRMIEEDKITAFHAQ